MNSFLDKTGLTYFWGKIKDAVSVKADKIQEVNHGTSDTTFTLTPNVMHIWGTVASLNLSLPTDSNSTLDEYLFTFTCPTGGTTLTLPASIVWIQEPEFEEGKTYQVSIVNGLAGFLTNNMVAGGGSTPGTETDPIFKASPAYGITASDITNWNGKQAALVSGTNIKTVNNESLLGSGNISIQGGGGDTNVIEVVKVNGTALTPDSNKAVNVPVPEKVSDIWNDLGYVSMNSVPQYETDPIFTASAAHGITSSDIANWNGKSDDTEMFTITGTSPTNTDFTSTMYTEIAAAISAGKYVLLRYIKSNVTEIYTHTLSSFDTATSISFYRLHGSYSQLYVNIYNIILNSDGTTTYNDARGYLNESADMYLPLAGGTMANTNLVTNLNADLLDGYNATEISRLGWVTTQNVGTGTSECSWFEIETPSSTGSLYSYEIITKRSSSTHPNIEHYKLDVFRYSSTSVSVSLINDGANYLYGNLYKVCVAVSTDSKVYIQHGSTGASSQRMYIRSTYGAGGISDTAVGSSTYGTANGFTAVGTVEITGYIRVDGSSVSYSGSTRFLTPATSVLNSVTVYSGSTAPSSSTGENGDIYIQTS